MSDFERNSIEELERSLRAMPASAGELDALGLMRTSVERHLAELSEAVVPALEAILSGSHVRGETVDVRFLVEMLGPLQEAVIAVGQAIEDRPTDRAPVPAHIRAATSMRVVRTFPGSFGVRLEGPAPADDGLLSLFPDEVDEPPSPFERSLDALLNVIDAAGSPNPDEAIRQTIAGLGRRTVAHVRNLAAAFVEGDDRLDLRWRNRAEERHTYLTHGTAENLTRVLSTTEIDEREVRMPGRLVGASLARKTFELETIDESIVKGQVAPAVLGYLALYFDRECVATVHISAARSTVDDTEQESYLLLGLE